ncbi:Ribonuclease H domain [Sesbania bispinosa]|nr:Ribonuclease H domain [Sesbania bispinosa]
MRFGAGNSSVWYDDWTGLGKLCLRLPFVHNSDTHLRVRDLWQNGSWCLSGLSTLVPEDVVRLIQELQVPLFASEDADRWCWQGSSTGLYTAQDGYVWLLSKDADLSSSRSWRWVWHLHCPEKIRFTIWLLLHHSLPTRELLSIRHIITNDHCPVCSNHSESTFHCFRDCERFHQLWTRLGFSSHRFFVEGNLWTWLTSNARGTQETLFLAVLWWIWKWRNNAIYDPSHWPLEIIIRNILLLQAELDSGTALDDGDSLLCSGSLGAGGVLRDSTGNWLWGFCWNGSQGSPLSAELHALQIGLSLAWDRGGRRMLVETDSLEAFHLLNRATPPADTPFRDILRDIFELI